MRPLIEYGSPQGTELVQSSPQRRPNQERSRRGSGNSSFVLLAVAMLVVGLDVGVARITFIQEKVVGFDLAAVATSEIFRKISQNLSPAGVTSPFEPRAMPTDPTSVVPVSGR